MKQRDQALRNARMRLNLKTIQKKLRNKGIKKRQNKVIESSCMKTKQRILGEVCFDFEANLNRNISRQKSRINLYYFSQL